MAATWSVRDEASFLAFYDASVSDAYGYASRLTGGDRARTEDLMQDVYLSLLRQAKAGAVTDASIGWVRTAVRHRFLDTVRSMAREDRRVRLVWPRPADPVDPPEADPLLGVAMSDRERAALTLRYIDDLAVPEVAATLGLSVRATESLLMRAKAKARSEVRDA